MCPRSKYAYWMHAKRGASPLKVVGRIPQHENFFLQITTFINVRLVFVFGLQTLWLKIFCKIYQLMGLKPKNKGHINFYECCYLTKKVYLNCTSRWPRPSFCLHYKWSFYNCFLLLFVGVLLFHTLKETLNWHFLLYMMAMEGLELPITLRITYTNLSWTNLNTKKGTWRNQRSKLSCK